MIHALPRYRLRHQGSDLEMPPGEFVVGRSSACNLALDDALVSRRHARIEVTPEGAFVEDLGSRNGVSVNGTRIPGRQRLSHLDRVTIGAHELVVVELPERGTAASRCERCGVDNPSDAAICRGCGLILSRGSPTLVGMTLELPAIGGGAAATAADEPTGRALLTGIADKALALGRFDEAERVIGRSLRDLAERARAGKHPNPAQLSEATSYALRLAEGTKRVAWLDWIFDIHASTGRLMSAEELERVHDLVRRLRYSGAAHVRRYVESIRSRASELGANERFLLSRLESLGRMISA